MPVGLAISVGSTEQHGPRRPLDTDTWLAGAVAGVLAPCLAKDPDLTWLAAPAIADGVSGEHQSFPGTISIGVGGLTTPAPDSAPDTRCRRDAHVIRVEECR